MDNGLAPWQEQPYWDSVVTTVTNLGVNTIGAVCQYDGTRVALLLGVQMGSGVFCRYLLNNPGATNEGIMVSANNGYLLLNYHDHGPLVWQQWFAIGTGPVNVTAYQARLKAWPSRTANVPNYSEQANAVKALASQVARLTNQQSALSRAISNFTASGLTIPYPETTVP